MERVIKRILRSTSVSKSSQSQGLIERDVEEEIIEEARIVSSLVGFPREIPPGAANSNSSLPRRDAVPVGVTICGVMGVR